MANLMPLPKISFTDSNGRPLVGGKVFFYEAGTSTPKNTYTDATGATPNTNPVILDARGEASIWLLNGIYKVKLCTQVGAEVWTVDNVSNKGDASIVDFIPAGAGAVARSVSEELNAKRIENIVALRAFSGRQTGDQALVTSYYSGWAALATGPSGGGRFVWDAASTATDDGFRFYAVSGVLTGRWRRIVSDPFDFYEAGAKGDGSTVDTTPMQTVIDYVTSLGGGVIMPKKGNYKCNLVIKQGVHISSGAGVYGYLASGSTSSVTFTAAASGWVVDTPATGMGNCSLNGVDFKGFGAGTACGGVRFQNTFWSAVKNCNFDLFADQAVLHVAGFACTFEDILTTNCLLNRTRAAVNGCVETTGTDDFLSRVECSASLTGGVTDANLRVVAIAVKGANHFVSNCVGEFADIGIYLNGNNHRVSNCRGDLNEGHGFMLSGSGQALISNCLALNNSKNASNVYSGFYTASGTQGVQMSNCRSDGSNHKYAYEDYVNTSDTRSRLSYSNCLGGQYVTGQFRTETQVPSSVHNAPFMIRPNSGTTIDVNNAGLVQLDYASPVTVTDFLNPTIGQRLAIRGSTNVTLQFGTGGTKITTNTGANKLLASNKVYNFTYFPAGWIEDE